MKYLLLIVLTGLASITYAQGPTYRNSVLVTIDYMTLDAPDDTGLRYSLRLGRHFFNDRLVVAGSAGYLQASQNRQAQTTFPLGTDQRKRLTADLTLLFDLVKASHQALRIGGGPSAWYRRDDLLRSFSTTRLPDGTLAAATVEREEVAAVTIGYHLTGEYEYLITPQVSLNGRIGWANLAGKISSMAGVGLGYRFGIK
ncbi:hypothetical protein ACFSUS_19425 [Spirosoma soli]|uniref:Outer membrane beta-barrel protein n=1 Tax=Spirosoma soli TaxID=1770529 RepID=A0ABW5M8J6_9BACT